MRFDKTRQDELSRGVERRLGRGGDPGRDLPDTAMLNGQEVSPLVANQLIIQAQQIADWVESFLPEADRRPQSKVVVTLSALKMFVSPPGQPPARPTTDQT